MAKITLTIEDRVDDPTAVDIHMEFDPPLPDNFEQTTMAQQTACAMAGYLKNLGDLAVLTTDAK